MVQRALQVVLIEILLTLSLRCVSAFPLSAEQSALPPGTEFNEEALERPREVSRTEMNGGRKSYLVNLGNLAFSSPAILGGAARAAGVSCSTCHVNGTSNARFYIPGMSTRPGTFDTTGAVFNPKADNGIRDAVRIPSLRGARYLAPYGHDGRTASLRDFVQNVIVNEFAGPAPAPAILDAIVAYIEDIDFLPNPRLGPAGRLPPEAGDAERRGEAVFFKPFPHDPQLSCATCHVPSGAFADHLQHDVGSGGLFKTPTLRNADFNAPYFHDGRFDTYDQVVAHFDRVFALDLPTQDRKDLVAYLTAIGDGIRPYERDSVRREFKEIDDASSVLGTAIPSHDVDIIGLAVRTVGNELRELTERFPDRKDTSIADGISERTLARSALKELVLNLRRIDVAASSGRFDEAATEYMTYRRLSFAAVPSLLATAEPWSLFSPKVHEAHYTAMRKTLQTAHTSSR
jgi:Di-haem cytochrome c peroxidase